MGEGTSPARQAESAGLSGVCVCARVECVCVRVRVCVCVCVCVCVWRVRALPRRWGHIRGSCVPAGGGGLSARDSDPACPAPSRHAALPADARSCQHDRRNRSPRRQPGRLGSLRRRTPRNPHSYRWRHRAGCSTTRLRHPARHVQQLRQVSVRRVDGRRCQVCSCRRRRRPPMRRARQDRSASPRAHPAPSRARP